MKKYIMSMLVLSLQLFGIENYEVFIKAYTNEEGRAFIVTRKFTDKGEIKYLYTDTQTFKTTISSLNNAQLSPLSQDFNQTNFAKTLHLATSRYVHGGISEKTTPLKKSIFLSMDMCPSLKHGYESDFLTHLVSLNGKTPIAIAITSKWIETHEEAFLELAKNPNLEITWVNHSHTHFYDPHLPNEENFMLHVNTNVHNEILELEKSLIKRGLTPSAFFRFPGLMADEKLMSELRETYFLIPIGSHAWVAKNEKIQNGSIILIHGNKNEHQGIEMLEEKLPSLVKHYTFKPLFEAFTTR